MVFHEEYIHHDLFTVIFAIFTICWWNANSTPLESIAINYIILHILSTLTHGTYKLSDSEFKTLRKSQILTSTKLKHLILSKSWSFSIVGTCSTFLYSFWTSFNLHCMLHILTFYMQEVKVLRYLFIFKIWNARIAMQ